MKDHAGYTEPEWERDEAARLNVAWPSCPDCGSAEDFGPRHHDRTDGSQRHYRACKFCGFWQEADGSPAYRIWLCIHECQVRLRQGQIIAHCTVCDADGIAPIGSVEWPHRCGRFLTPWESGFTCSNCRQFITSSEPLRSRGSDAA